MIHTNRFQSQNKPSGFNFGSSTPSTSSFGFGTSTPASAPSFGTVSAPVSQPSGFGFGASTSAATSSFGAPLSLTQQPSSGFNFGSSSTNVQQPSSGFGFGSNSLNTKTGFGQASSGFGQAPVIQTAGGLFNRSTQPQMQQPQITLDTKYSDLPEALKNKINEIEKYIHSQITINEELNARRNISQRLDSISKDITILRQQVTGLDNLLQRDKIVLEELRQNVNKELKNSDLIQRFLERDPNTRQVGNGSVPVGSISIDGQNNFLRGSSVKYDSYLHYFVELATSLENRMTHYLTRIEELEASISSRTTGNQNPTQSLVEALKAQDDGLVALSIKVAHLGELVEKDSSAYNDFRNQYR